MRTRFTLKPLRASLPVVLGLRQTLSGMYDPSFGSRTKSHWTKTHRTISKRTKSQEDKNPWGQKPMGTKTHGDKIQVRQKPRGTKAQGDKTPQGQKPMEDNIQADNIPGGQNPKMFLRMMPLCIKARKIREAPTQDSRHRHPKPGLVPRETTTHQI